MWHKNTTQVGEIIHGHCHVTKRLKDLVAKSNGKLVEKETSCTTKLIINTTIYWLCYTK